MEGIEPSPEISLCTSSDLGNRTLALQAHPLFFLKVYCLYCCGISPPSSWNYLKLLTIQVKHFIIGNCDLTVFSRLKLSPSGVVILTTPHNPVEEDLTTSCISDTTQGAVLMGSRLCLFKGL